MLDFSTLPKIVAVVGSRKYPHLNWIDKAVGRMTNTEMIVSGGAEGADTAAKQAAEKYRKVYKDYHIKDEEWKIVGKIAAYIRNRAIVLYIQKTKGHVVIFAVLEDGQFPKDSGSKMVFDLCQSFNVDYTVIDQFGEVVWTTHAAFATNQ